MNLTRDQVEGWKMNNGAMSPNEFRALCDLALLAFAPSAVAVASRDEIIEECAKHIEASPITYFGPDPGGVRDLRYLIVAAIRDMKGKT